MNSRIKELINPFPGYKILHVSSNPDSFITQLEEMLNDVEGRLNLAIYGQNKDSKQGLQYINNYTNIFRGLPRDHDVVILHELFSKHEQKSKLLKSTYETLANAAYIIILEPNGLMDISNVKEMLYEHEFRAANEIDIIQGYDLIMAKKMHMWGNGL